MYRRVSRDDRLDAIRLILSRYRVCLVAVVDNPEEALLGVSAVIYPLSHVIDV